MNVAELYRLSRRLRDMTLAVVAEHHQSPISAGQLTIVEDIFHAAPTTVSEITKRTGLAQSFVSKIIMQLRDSELVRVEQSTTDRRQSFISLNPNMSEFVNDSRDRPILPVLAELLPEADRNKAERLERILEELAELIGSK